MAGEPHAVLDDAIAHVRNSFSERRSIMSFSEYFELVRDNPRPQLRTSAQYVVDMIDHFGRETLDLPTGEYERYKVFDAPFDDGERRVAGQERIQEELYRILSHFAREGRVNKVILLHGPNGSAKSSLVRCLMAGLESYSKTHEGALYTFNWIFPSTAVSKGGIGFSTDHEAPASAGGSHAFLPPDQIDARIPASMQEHPLFLFPREERTKMIDALIPDHATEIPVGDYLRFGELSHKSRMIFDALLTAYEGDIEKVLNHVQVQRFYLNRRYRSGIATIEPQMSVDANIRQVTSDRTLVALPKTLQHISLFEMSGPLVDANRGILEFSDLLKRPVEAFKYLLSTAETATVSMDSFVLHLDMVYIASTNETYLDAFKEHPDFASFKGRMELIKVPYLLRYDDERAIYAAQISERMVGKHVAPHAIDVAAYWAVLTRMRRCDSSRYSKELQTVIESITPQEKLKLYNSGEIPDRLTTREAQQLRQLTEDIFKESIGYPNYEGRWGASAREIRTALLNAAHHDDYTYLSPVAVFEEIREILGSKGVYDFLKQEVVGKYHDHASFLQQTEELYVDWIDEEVRDSMGLAPEESYLELFSRYITHVSHWVKQEKMRDPSSGRMVEPDEKFMGEIEAVLMGQGEKAEDFRRSVIGNIGANALDNPDVQPNYGALFKQYIQRLREDFYAKRRKVLSKHMESFLHLTTRGEKGLEAKELAVAKDMLAKMKSKYGYNDESARDTVAHLQKKRYSS